jgi:ankyrin repeat protein
MIASATRTVALLLACLVGAAAFAQSPAAAGPALAAAARQGQEDAVERLLAAGADPDRQDAGGATALMEATRNGHYAAVQRLLKYGARKDLRDDAGRTALDLAVQHGRTDLIALLRDAS